MSAMWRDLGCVQPAISGSKRIYSEVFRVAKRSHASRQLNVRERPFDLILRPSTPNDGSTLIPDADKFPAQNDAGSTSAA
jgi:hypothetical protein